MLWQKHLSPSLDYGKWIAGIIRGRTFQLFYRQLIVQFQPRYLLSTYKPVHLLHRISYVSQMPCYEVWRLGVSDHRLVARFPTPSEHRPLVSTTTTLTPFGGVDTPFCSQLSYLSFHRCWCCFGRTRLFHVRSTLCSSPSNLGQLPCFESVASHGPQIRCLKKMLLQPAPIGLLWSKFISG